MQLSYSIKYCTEQMMKKIVSKKFKNILWALNCSQETIPASYIRVNKQKKEILFKNNL